MTIKYHIDQNPLKGNRGLTRAWHAAKNSWSGITYTFKEESGFRQELLMLCMLTPIAMALPTYPLEKIALIASLVLVLVVKLLNSSVEAAIDRISFEHHDLSKRAKDYGSAAAMLALCIALLFWAVICTPPLS